MTKKHLLLAYLSLLWMGCEENAKKIDFQPVFSTGGKQLIDHRTTYSSRLEGYGELWGTIFDHQYYVIQRQKGDTAYWEREPVKSKAKGWNKKLIAKDMEKLVPLSVKVVEKTFSFSGYKSVLDTITKMGDEEKSVPMQKAIRKRVLSAIDTMNYVSEWKLRWYLLNLLKKGSYSKGQHLEFDSSQTTTENVSVDSIVILGEQNHHKRGCLDYKVYYTRIDSIRTDMESALASYDLQLKKMQISFLQPAKDGGPRIIEEGRWVQERLAGEWWLSRALDNGGLCYEYKKESITVSLYTPKAIKAVDLIIYRFSENLYQ